MKRFFEFLYPERTHLKAVIAALVAIFLLSGVLAYQVYASEKVRRVQQEKLLHNYGLVGATRLHLAFTENSFQQLRTVFLPAIRVDEMGGSFDDARAAVAVANFCTDCAEVPANTPVYSVDFARREAGGPVSQGLIKEIAETRAGTIKEHWVGGIFFSNIGEEIRTIAFARQRYEGLDRGWVVILPAEYATWIGQRVLDAVPLISHELVSSVPRDSVSKVVFRAEAVFPNVGTISTSPLAAGSEPAIVAEPSPVFPGTAWRVAVLPRGRDLLLPQSSIWLSPNLMLLLMALILGVIVMAIAVVRREEELHRLRSDLISGVSHELRTPLAQIRMFAETLLLGRTRTEAEKRRSLEVIDQEAKRLSHFVENMLQFAKGEGGRTRLAPEHSSFAVEIRRAVESFAPMCQARGVEVRTELEEGVTAPVDRSALRRVMLNLMENALKYGPDEQRITVGTALFNDVVRVWVDDEGEGIPRADRERVFDSFYRLNRELDRRITGSGIGLAVVRQLATLHGGRAWAEEAPGGGARLVVEFPEAYVRAPEENTGTGWAVA